MRVRLTRKFAEEIDGVDLRGHSVGDVLDVSPAEGRLLIAEEWAVVERRRGKRSQSKRPAGATKMPSKSTDVVRRTRRIAARPPEPGGVLSQAAASDSPVRTPGARRDLRSR
jgi:hypothetical protein